MDATANARRLRRDQTLAEKRFWKLVRNRRLGGFRFLRQVPIDRYFADFVCEAGKLIFELDGPTHEEREDYDARRTEDLELFGYVVLRFPNDRVLADPCGVGEDILAVLRSDRVKPLTLPPPSAAGPSLSQRERVIIPLPPLPLRRTP